MKQYKHVKGYVTLSYMLRVLEKELKVKIDNKFQHTDFSDESMTYNKNVIVQISPLLTPFGWEGIMRTLSIILALYSLNAIAETSFETTAQAARQVPLPAFE